MIALLLAALAAVPQPATTPQCHPLAGAEKILSDRSLRWIVVGEQHGTAETPVVFSDLACLAADFKRPAVIALEYPVEEGPRIDAYLESDGKKKAQAALLSGPFWHGVKDGRSSRAFLALFERLRRMKAKGRIRNVVPFQPAHSLSSADYEQAMAKVIKDASDSPDALVLVLVGNIHARTKIWRPRSGSPYMPLGGILPQQHTRSLNAVGNGGAQWSCFGNAAGSEPKCEAREFGAARQPRDRGIVLSDDSDAPYSGALFLGVPTTASPPALPD